MGVVMKRMGVGAVAVMILGCTGAPGEDGSIGPIVVELVGPGRLSTELPEFATAFSPSGDTVYFNRTPPDRSRLDLYASVRVGEAWSEATPFGPTLNQAAIDPFVSLDGRRLYFSSDMADDGEAAGSFNLWFVERTESGWSAPEQLPPPVSSDSSDVYSSFTSDGRLVFSSRREGVRRIYVTRESGDGWETPTPITFADSLEGSNPAVSPDGSVLVFSAPGASGRPDLWVACWVDGAWTNAAQLPAPINTDFTEFAPSIWGDDLFFTSERPGVHGPVPDSIRPPGDLYRTDLAHASRRCATAASHEAN